MDVMSIIFMSLSSHLYNKVLVLRRLTRRSNNNNIVHYRSGNELLMANPSSGSLEIIITLTEGNLLIFVAIQVKVASIAWDQTYNLRS